MIICEVTDLPPSLLCLTPPSVEAEEEEEAAGEEVGEETSAVLEVAAPWWERSKAPEASGPSSTSH